MTNCTTHHHACDCREAMFAEMVEALKEIAWLRPKGEVETCKSPRELVRQMEIIALSAIARATDQGEMK